jgi:AmiR/NasT family two-component response regulator
VIERAKGLLMEKEKLTGGEAFARPARRARSQRPLKVIAEAVVATCSAASDRMMEHPNKR